MGGLEESRASRGPVRFRSRAKREQLARVERRSHRKWLKPRRKIWPRLAYLSQVRFTSVRLLCHTLNPKVGVVSPFDHPARSLYQGSPRSSDPNCLHFASERVWHIYDTQDQIMDLAFRYFVPFVRMETRASGGRGEPFVDKKPSLRFNASLRFIDTT